MHNVEDAGGRSRCGSGGAHRRRGRVSTRLSVLLASPLGDLDHVGQGLLDLLPATGLETAVRVDEDAARTTSASPSSTASRMSRYVLLLVREGLHESGETVLHLLDTRDTRPAKKRQRGQRSLRFKQGRRVHKLRTSGCRCSGGVGKRSARCREEKA